GAGDDGVAVGARLFHSEGVGAVAHEFVEFDEGAVVEQQFDAFARGLLAFGVLFGDGGFAACGDGLVVALFEVGEFSCGGEQVVFYGFVGHAPTLSMRGQWLGEWGAQRRARWSTKSVTVRGRASQPRAWARRM